MSTKKRVLLVDDDVDFVDANKAVLENNGYDVTVAYDGKQCLEKVRSDRPDVIVLDVMMATQSEGFDISRDLRNSEHTKRTPILMVTSINDTVPYKFERDDTWLPVDSFIEKPIAPQKLLEELSRMVSA